MLVAVVAGENGGGRLAPLRPTGAPAGRVTPVAALADAVAGRERRDHPRWVWAGTDAIYPGLLRAGVQVDRCHDLELTESLLLGYDGRWGEPRALPAAWARLTGGPVPPDPPPRQAEPPGGGQAALFDAGPRPVALDADPLTAVTEVYADQAARIGRTAHPGRFRMLVAAESAGALIAAEMGRDGLPFSASVHERLLAEMLGPPSPVGGRPRRLAELATRINDAFGVHGLNPDSPAELLRAFAKAGFALRSTRAWVLRDVRHPAVPLVLEYKELARIWTAHGWAWREAWVRDGRFRSEFVPGGVVSGRWASRGGGALQIPKVIRRAVVADPGWKLVVADAGQLEPRVLAAVSGDDRLAAAASAGDLYAALAADAFGGDRAKAKVALLGAMYGQTGGAAIPALAVLRRSYPRAFDHVEAAARTGEQGGLVRSWLGRTCPPPHAELAELSAETGDTGGGSTSSDDDGELPRSRPDARARGRFTRNFVIQATAAEWALVLLATLRGALAGTEARLVFFQHDEVIIHCPAEQATEVAAAAQHAADRAGRLLFGDSPVRFPLAPSIVDCYADAKP